MWCVILAAGFSRRMGQQKLLLPLGSQQSVLGAVIETSLRVKSLKGVIVVVRDDDEAVQSLVRTYPVTCLSNAASDLGMSTSLILATHACAKQSADAMMVLLGDMPGVRSETMVAMVDAYTNHRAPFVQARYRDGLSHPVLFDQSLFQELGAVRGDEGARSILQKYRTEAVTVDVPLDVPMDLDTPEAYTAYLRREDWKA